ncbi:MAG: type II secretion system protein [Candidatus Buchananbacteria bacterium]|nr:type II secretion system protein [Candidatus Buchananbacteria bacterium]
MKQTTSRGFTLIDLMVAAVIIIIMFSYVLANFRTAQFSGEIDVSNKRLVNLFKVARNYSLGGQLLANQSFPDGGYGVYLNLNSPSTAQMYAALDQSANGFSDGELIPAQTLNFKDITLIDLCGAVTDEITTLPCQSGWEDAGNYLEVIFDETGGAVANYDAGSDFKHIGGVIKSSRTNQQAFFMVSLLSGGVTGNLYDRRD